MSFLNGETIKERILELIVNHDGSSSPLEFRNVLESKVDCNSITLSLGPEGYVTGAKLKQKIQLNDDVQITISCGQFAILLTEEFISIPNDLFGMISMKSKFKFMGLINVSGFHVDPGWKGRLIFTVYNAGPDDINIARGDPAFLIWFATLNEKTVLTKEIETPCSKIKTDFINQLKSEEYSPQLLIKRIQSVELSHRWIACALLVSILLGIFVGIGSDYISYIMKDDLGYEEEMSKERYSKMMSEIKDLREKMKEMDSHHTKSL
jgi:dCTP deaminase